MSDPGFFESIARDLTGPGMFGGKFQFRLILQPLAAIILGLRFGVRDAKTGKAPFLDSVARAKGGRGALLKGAIRDAMIPLILAVVIDSILQQLINHRIRPLVALFVGSILVFLPFLIVRSLAHRAWSHGHPGSSQTARKSP